MPTLATDRTGNAGNAPNYPASNAFTITPSDTNELDTITTGVYIGTAGDLKVVMAGGETVTFKSLAAGIVHRMRVRQVFSTGTTCVNVIGMY